MKALTIAAALIALSAPAFAADGTATDPAPSDNGWAGTRVGAQLGYGWGRDHIHDEERSSPGTSDYSDHFNLEGVSGGVFAGFNWQDGPWVYGTELDIGLSDVHGDNPAWPFGTDMKANIAAQGSLRGRIGYVCDEYLFYATGGLALGDIETRYYDGAARDSYSEWTPGWTVGAGIERTLVPQWTARVEYRYADFGRVTDWTKNTDFFWNEHNEITEHMVLFGVAYAPD